jgi:hypothetical protein
VIVSGKSRLYRYQKNNENHAEHELNFHRDQLGSEILGDFNSLGGLCDEFGNLYPLFMR